MFTLDRTAAAHDPCASTSKELVLSDCNDSALLRRALDVERGDVPLQDCDDGRGPDNDLVQETGGGSSSSSSVDGAGAGM